MKQSKGMDEYIADFPPKIRTLLKQIRKTIRETAPDAEETISYGMPAFRQGRILVYFAAFKNHIGFFPTASGVSAFKKELKRFECTKGTIRLPFDQPLPLPLIRRIVKFRVREIRPE